MRILKAAVIAVVTLGLATATTPVWALDDETDSETRRSPFFVAMMAASAGDVASTEWGMRRGLYEGNPLARNRGVRVAAHVAGPALAWYGTEKLRKAGHGRIALIARIGVIAAYGYATAHNLRAASVAR